MKIVTYGNKQNKVVLLIPPGGLDERCFSHLLPYLSHKYVVIPVLNGNVIGEQSTLISRRNEADEIVSKMLENGITEIEVMNGISYGASVALEVLMTRKLQIKKTVLDGGSFLKYGWFMKTCNYIGTVIFVKGIKRSPDKPSIYAALGENIDEASKQVFMNMSNESLKNLIKDSMNGADVGKGNILEEDHLLIIYGSKDGYRGGVKWFQKNGYTFKSILLDNYRHCEYFATHPKEYVQDFIYSEHFSYTQQERVHNFL